MLRTKDSKKQATTKKTTKGQVKAHAQITWMQSPAKTFLALAMCFLLLLPPQLGALAYANPADAAKAINGQEVTAPEAVNEDPPPVDKPTSDSSQSPAAPEVSNVADTQDPSAAMAPLEADTAMAPLAADLNAGTKPTAKGSNIHTYIRTHDTMASGNQFHVLASQLGNPNPSDLPLTDASLVWRPKVGGKNTGAEAFPGKGPYLRPFEIGMDVSTRVEVRLNVHWYEGNAEGYAICFTVPYSTTNFLIATDEMSKTHIKQSTNSTISSSINLYNGGSVNNRNNSFLETQAMADARFDISKDPKDLERRVILRLKDLPSGTTLLNYSYDYYVNTIFDGDTGDLTPRIVGDHGDKYDPATTTQLGHGTPLEVISVAPGKFQAGLQYITATAENNLSQTNPWWGDAMTNGGGAASAGGTINGYDAQGGAGTATNRGYMQPNRSQKAKEGVSYTLHPIIQSQYLETFAAWTWTSGTRDYKTLWSEPEIFDDIRKFNNTPRISGENLKAATVVITLPPEAVLDLKSQTPLFGTNYQYDPVARTITTSAWGSDAGRGSNALTMSNYYANTYRPRGTSFQISYNKPPSNGTHYVYKVKLEGTRFNGKTITVPNDDVRHLYVTDKITANMTSDVRMGTVYLSDDPATGSGNLYTDRAAAINSYTNQQYNYLESLTPGDHATFTYRVQNDYAGVSPTNPSASNYQPPSEAPLKDVVVTMPVDGNLWEFEGMWFTQSEYNKGVLTNPPVIEFCKELKITYSDGSIRVVPYGIEDSEGKITAAAGYWDVPKTGDPNDRSKWVWRDGSGPNFDAAALINGDTSRVKMPNVAIGIEEFLNTGKDGLWVKEFELSLRQQLENADGFTYGLYTQLRTEKADGTPIKVQTTVPANTTDTASYDFAGLSMSVSATPAIPGFEDGTYDWQNKKVSDLLTDGKYIKRTNVYSYRPVGHSTSTETTIGVLGATTNVPIYATQAQRPLADIVMSTTRLPTNNSTVTYAPGSAKIALIDLFRFYTPTGSYNAYVVNPQANIVIPDFLDLEMSTVKVYIGRGLNDLSTAVVTHANYKEGVTSTGAVDSASPAAYYLLSSGDFAVEEIKDNALINASYDAALGYGYKAYRIVYTGEDPDSEFDGILRAMEDWIMRIDYNLIIPEDVKMGTGYQLRNYWTEDMWLPNGYHNDGGFKNLRGWHNSAVDEFDLDGDGYTTKPSGADVTKNSDTLDRVLTNLTIALPNELSGKNDASRDTSKGNDINSHTWLRDAKEVVDQDDVNLAKVRETGEIRATVISGSKVDATGDIYVRLPTGDFLATLTALDLHIIEYGVANAQGIYPPKIETDYSIVPGGKFVMSYYVNPKLDEPVTSPYEIKDGWVTITSYEQLAAKQQELNNLQQEIWVKIAGVTVPPKSSFHLSQSYDIPPDATHGQTVRNQTYMDLNSAEFGLFRTMTNFAGLYVIKPSYVINYYRDSVTSVGEPEFLGSSEFYGDLVAATFNPMTPEYVTTGDLVTVTASGLTVKTPEKVFGTEVVNEEEVNTYSGAGVATLNSYKLPGYDSGVQQGAVPFAISEGIAHVEGQAGAQTTTNIINVLYLPKDYTVHYDTNGGTPSPIPSDTEVLWTDNDFYPSTTLTKKGYTFEGWELKNTTGVKAAQLGKVFKSGSVNPQYKDMVNNEDVRSITLVAKWEPIKYNVSYEWTVWHPIEEKMVSTSIADFPDLPAASKKIYEELVKVDPSVKPNDEPNGVEYTDSTGTYMFVFSGWQTKNATVNYADPNKPEFNMPANDVVLTGVWEAVPVHQYEIQHIYVDKDGKVIGDPFESTVLWASDKAKNGVRVVSATPKSDKDLEGYHYQKGFSNNSGDEELLSSQLLSDNSLVLKIFYQINTWDITYTYTGEVPDGVDDPTTLGEENVAYGEDKEVAKNPTKEGYIFSGWVPKSAGVSVDSSGAFVMPDNNVIFEGSWKSDYYTVHYDTNGGTPSPIPSKTDVFWLDNDFYPDTELGKPGHTFKGWALKDGDGTILSNESYKALADEDVDMREITLIAVWEPNTYEVDYAWTVYHPVLQKEMTIAEIEALSGAKFPTIPDPSEWEYDAEVEIDGKVQPNDEPKAVVVEYTDPDSGELYKFRFVFSGWQTDNAILDYADDGLSHPTFNMPANDVHLKGIWEAVPVVRYEIQHIYVDENGDDIETFEKTVLWASNAGKEYGIERIVEAIPKSDADLVGYHYDEDLSTPSAVLEEGLVLAMRYPINVNTIKYIYTGDVPEDENLASAESFGETDVPYLKKKSVAEAPELAGYTFKGWVPKSIGLSVENGEFAMPDAEAVFEGEWVANLYTVHYDANGGTPSPIPSLTDILWKDNNIYPADPIRPGYTFTGWEVVSGGNGSKPEPGVAYSDLANNDQTKAITLQAQWVPNTYNVSYVVTITHPKTGLPIDITIPVAPPTSTHDVDSEVAISQNYAGEKVTYSDEYGDFTFVFSGWQTTDVIMSYDVDGNPVFAMPNNDVVMFGTWEAEPVVPYTIEHYRVEFVNGEYVVGDMFESTSLLASMLALDGETFRTITAIPKELDGYTFDQNFEGTVLSVQLVDVNGIYVMKLFYKIDSHKVTFSYTGDVPPGAPIFEEIVGTAGQKIKLEEPSLTGYDFSGWVIPEGVSVDPDTGEFVMPNGPVNFTGSWTPKTYKVTFDPNGKDVEGFMDEASATFGQPLKMPENGFTREGYSFVGWTIINPETGEVLAILDDLGQLDSYEFPFDVVAQAMWVKDEVPVVEKEPIAPKEPEAPKEPKEKKATPKLGDDPNTWLWLAVALMSLLVAWVGFGRMKDRRLEMAYEASSVAPKDLTSTVPPVVPSGVPEIEGSEPKELKGKHVK